MKLPRMLALIVAAVLATPAMGQDGSEATEKRTVEGAQKFLTELYAQPGARAKAMGYVSHGEWAQDSTPGATFEMAEGPIAQMQTIARCASRITVSPAIKWRTHETMARTPIAASSGRLVVDLNWAILKKITLEDDWLISASQGKSMTGYTSVIVTFVSPSGEPKSTILSHLSKEAADRAAFAMQFLADQCGFKTDTGF